MMVFFEATDDLFNTGFKLSGQPASAALLGHHQLDNFEHLLCKSPLELCRLVPLMLAGVWVFYQKLPGGDVFADIPREIQW